jgi:hypothetical protein
MYSTNINLIENHIRIILNVFEIIALEPWTLGALLHI